MSYTFWKDRFENCVLKYDKAMEELKDELDELTVTEIELLTAKLKEERERN
jgi:1,4-alpha-glucan branching enzyme